MNVTMKVEGRRRKRCNDECNDEGRGTADDGTILLVLLWMMMILVVVPRRGGMSCELSRRMMALEARVAPVGSGADVAIAHGAIMARMLVWGALVGKVLSCDLTCRMLAFEARAALAGLRRRGRL